MNCVHEEALAIIGPMYALKAELVHIWLAFLVWYDLTKYSYVTQF